MNNPIPRNIVVFGQTGSGKSSIINMLAGSTVADVDGSASGCTTSNQAHTIKNGEYTFWDTAGLNEGDHGAVSSQVAVQQLLELFKNNDANLLVYCIRARLVNITRINYDLVWKIICAERLPIVLVVTGLEGETDIDGWWPKNEKRIRKLKLSFAGHACITSWKGRQGEHKKEYEESIEKLWRLVREHHTRKSCQLHMAAGWQTQVLQKIDLYEKNYKANGISKLLKKLGRVFRSR